MKQHLLLQGDQNTKFFHTYATAKRKKNAISRLSDDVGIQGDRLVDLSKNYFSQIFTSTSADIGTFLDNFSLRIIAVENARLIQPFTYEEVKEAVFSMALDKSPDPADGFNLALFQHFWVILVMMWLVSFWIAYIRDLCPWE